MITAAQMRAARALLGIDQKRLAELSEVSLPTIQRMEASEGNVCAVVDTLSKVVEAVDAAGVEHRQRARRALQGSGGEGQGRLTKSNRNGDRRAPPTMPLPTRHQEVGNACPHA